MPKKISTNELKENIEADIKWIDENLDMFENLSSDQMLSRPSTGKWNAEECLAHMSILYAIYVRNMQKAITRSEKRHLSPTTEYTPGLLGNYLTGFMEPESQENVGDTMKTLKIFDPQRNYHSERLPLQNFKSYHEEFKKLLDKIDDYNLEKIKVKSSIGNIIRFKLGDCYRFITAHNKRHTVQAIKAVNSWQES